MSFDFGMSIFKSGRLQAVVLACGVLLTMKPQSAAAQTTEERFQDLFVTAGYATAFGAALGAAMLSFVPDPASELRYVAIGASLGFIGGSALGTYVIFSPMMTVNDSGTGIDNLAREEKGNTNHNGRLVASAASVSAYAPPRKGLRIVPEINGRQGTLDKITGQWTLATF